MTVDIGALAVVWTIYIAWDESFDLPIGQRKPSTRLKLFLMDLFFVPLMSANVSLAWEAL